MSVNPWFINSVIHKLPHQYLHQLSIELAYWFCVNIMSVAYVQQQKSVRDQISKNMQRLTSRSRVS